jgi:outer membrane protein TolC
MKKSIQILLVATSFILSKSIFSQESWTLDDCVAYALAHNLKLNDFEYNIESNRETYRQSFRDLLPSIRAVSDYSIRFGRSVDPNDNSISNTDFFSNNYSLEASLDLFRGFQKLNSIKASKLIYKSAQEEKLQQKYLLAFRIMQAFYDIQFLKGALAIAREQEAISRTNYNLVKKQIELGLMAGADLYETESLLLADILNVTTTANQLVASKLTLIQEMNLKGVTDITLLMPLREEFKDIETSEIHSDSIFNKAKNFIPIIRAEELRAKAAKKQLAVERSNLYPSLSLFGGYGTGYYETITDSLGVTIPFGNQFKDNTFQFIGVSLNIPISGGGSLRSKVKQQKIALMRADNNLDLQKQELYQTIQTLVQEYYALQVEYNQTDKNMEAQKLVFTVAQKRYEKGLISAIELFTVKNLFATAQNQNLQVRLRAEVNRSTLDFYRGIPIFNIHMKNGFGN